MWNPFTNTFDLKVGRPVNSFQVNPWKEGPGDKSFFLSLMTDGNPLDSEDADKAYWSGYLLLSGSQVISPLLTPMDKI